MEETTIYKVVMNHEGQYSIVLSSVENPRGWKDAGKTGKRNECLSYIKEVWTDMRPLSLRGKWQETTCRPDETKTGNARDVCIHHLFEDQAVRKPDALAVIFEDQQLTYRELNSRANQLAHHLQQFITGPEVKVGLCLERSVEMVVGILGILKAGGVYVPLDPAYPFQRLAFITQDAQVSVLLTQERLLEKFRDFTGQVICLDKDWSFISKHKQTNPLSTSSARSLSHVIYTSGSTGVPKGVMVTHSSVFHNVKAIQTLLDITPNDVYLHTASLAFTSSLRQLLLPLSVGASIVIATPEQRTNPLALFDLIKQQGVTVMDTVAVFWESCTNALSRLESRERDKLLKNNLRLIVSSGGELPSSIPKNWRFHFKHGAGLINMYGQTETIGNTLVYPIPAEYDDALRVVPLGPPIAHTQLYLLDQDLRPVPPGAPAELHMGGHSLARGYLNQPELTAEKFLPDPFSSEPGSRLYRTGDRGCFLPDGTIEFLGRSDNQFKIRGFRIEPGEIEAELKKHSAIQETVVVAREDEPGEKRLVAYYVPDPDKTPTINELRTQLDNRLPEYMVPSAFVMLSSLPRMPNGKIDRHALPPPEGKRPDLGQPYVPPQSELEHYLANQWCEILKLDRVGIDDRFFELGGTSIQAARFVNRLQSELNQFIYIISLFEAPSIREYICFLKKHCTQAIARRFPKEVVSTLPSGAEKKASKPPLKLDDSAINQMRRCIPSLSPTKKAQDGEESKNSPTLFVLAPPRSGSMLLRIMLAGHPDLFAASELQLLGFNTLAERKSAFNGKYRVWLDGTIRALMEMKRCGKDQAEAIMKEYEDRACTTKEFYGQLQQWIDKKTLVDESSTYAFDSETLKKAEEDFHNPLYIHLVCHPYAMIGSFENYPLAQSLYLYDHPFSVRELGELLWTISHQNILAFLNTIPADRKYRIRVEDLSTRSQEVMEEMCDTLNLKYHEDLLQPWRESDNLTTDGSTFPPVLKNNINVNEQHNINPKVTESLRQAFTDNPLSDRTMSVAENLGYDHPLDQQDECLPHEMRRTTISNARRKFAERQRQIRLSHRLSKE